MKVKVGDTVRFKNRLVHVVAMEVTSVARSKYGNAVTEVDVELINQNRVVFTLSNGLWAYSEEVTPIVASQEYEFTVIFKRNLSEDLNCGESISGDINKALLNQFVTELQNAYGGEFKIVSGPSLHDTPFYAL